MCTQLSRMEAVGEAPLRVRYLGGNYLPVRLVREASMQDVEKAIAGAVRLPVGTFFLKGADGGTTVMDSTLTGDWEAVRLLLTVGPPTSWWSPLVYLFFLPMNIGVATLGILLAFFIGLFNHAWKIPLLVELAGAAGMLTQVNVSAVVEKNTTAPQPA